MSKNVARPIYFTAPSLEEINAIGAKNTAVKRAGRKTRRLKVEPCIETVVLCLAGGMSSRSIVRVVKAAHQYSISKDCILRFSKTLPPTAKTSF